jgi:hypothetical protein
MLKAQIAAAFASTLFSLPAMANNNPVHMGDYTFPTDPTIGAAYMPRLYPKSSFSHGENPEETYRKHVEYFEKAGSVRAHHRYSDINFDGRGPHYLRIWPNGPSTWSNVCSFTVDAIDRKTGKATPLIESYPFNYSLGPQVHADGLAVNKNLDGVVYSFQVFQCENNMATSKKDGIRIRVTQDLSNSPEYRGAKEAQANKQKLHDLSNDPSMLSIRFVNSDHTALVSDDIIKVQKHSAKTLTFGWQTNREIAFQTSNSSDKELGISSLFTASIKKGIQQSFEEKFGQTYSESVEVHLNGDTCPNWRVKKYQTRKLGYVSAKKMGIDQEVPFSIVSKQDIEAINLCDPENTQHVPN